MLMNKLIAHMRRNLDENKERGVTLAFAILILFLVISVGAAIVSLALTATVGSRNLNYTMAYQAASDSALANAVLVANSPDGGKASLEAHNGSTQAVSGALNQASSSYPVKWRWYTAPVASSSAAQRAYYVYADAYTRNPNQPDARHVRVILQPLAAAKATAAGSKITYVSDPSAVYAFGPYGINSVNLLSGTKIGSYDSLVIRAPANSDGNTSVGSNGTLNLDTGSGLNQFFASGDAAQCLGNGCAGITTTTNDYKVSLDGITTLVATACPNDPTTYPSWSASSGTQLVNGGCYNTLNFDANTPIGLPTKVYVKGNITVSSGAQVNYNGLPTSLQIYSQVGSTATLNNGTTSAPTYFNGVIAGANLNCTDTATTASNIPTLSLYGSLACNRITLGPATQTWVDQESRNIAVNNGTQIPAIYQVTGYQVNGSAQ
jgi:hypothetical protein